MAIISSPLISLAAKFPLALLSTIVFAPFDVEAVVLALSIVPLVMFEALIAVRATPLPEIEVDVIAPALNSPDVPRRTIVEAPLAVAAVVLALAIVPVLIFDALIALIADPLAVIMLAVKLPLASRATMVDAPLASEAVVLALAIVPEAILDALIAVKATPFPEIEVVVMAFAVKLPEASRATIVLAPLAEVAVVLAFEIVPLVMFEALMSVRAAPFPE